MLSPRVTYVFAAAAEDDDHVCAKSQIVALVSRTCHTVSRILQLKLSPHSGVETMDFFSDIAGGNPYKPSLFELVAQEQLRDLLQPALKYVLTVRYRLTRYRRALALLRRDDSLLPGSVCSICGV